MDAFKENQVLGDVIDDLPQTIAQVHYTQSKVDVNLGNILTPTLVQHQPEVSWEADKGSFYTLIMTDPDAPSRKDPKFREWHHWLVVNIPGNNVLEGEIKSGYVGSGPPKDTSLHRYVFLVYKQHGKQDFSSVHHLSSHTAKNREKFSARNFAKKFNLGPIVASNFYQAEYDDYVPKLYASFKE